MPPACLSRLSKPRQGLLTSHQAICALSTRALEGMHARGVAVDEISAGASCMPSARPRRTLGPACAPGRLR